MRTQWPPEFGKRVLLWDAVYAQDAAAVQKLLATPSGVAQVNTPHGVRCTLVRTLKRFA